MLKMLTDHMEDGFLDNIISLFRKDETLYPLIGDMLGDERVRVRLGTIALVETMMNEEPDKVKAAIPFIAALLKNSNATIRGDAVYALGIIGDRDALPFLTEAAKDENEMVREAIKESIETIKKG
jgi:HEAT repeat protein